MIRARRGFLGGIAAALATPAIVRAESIWVPPPRRVLVTRLGVLHGYTYARDYNAIMREALETLRNSNAFIEMVNAEHQKDIALFLPSRAAIRLPTEYRVG